MADIETLNKEEFDSLHPSIKEYVTAGIDTNPYGDRLVGQNNFFNLNLFNSNPLELDPNLIERTEDTREKLGVGGALAYGWKGGVSSVIELVGSIPGGLDRFYDWGRTTLGFQPTEDSIFDYAEDYLKDIAHDWNPENKSLLHPTGFAEKVAAGFGSALPAIASYIPAIRVLKGLKGVGKVSSFLQKRSLPAGIALTDITREIDDGSMADIAMAGTYGYGTGKILQVANNLNVLPRMAVLGATGFASAGWEANLEDRMASTVVWSTLGIAGPWAEGKSIKRALSDYEVQTKQILGQIDKPKIVKDRINELTVELDSLKKGRDSNLAYQRKQLEETGLAGKEYAQAKESIDKLEAKDPSTKRINEIESQLKSFKKLDQLGPVRGLAAEYIGHLGTKVRLHENLISEHKKVAVIEEANQKLISEGKEPKIIEKDLQDKLMSVEQLAKHEKHVVDLKAEAKAFGKVLYSNLDYNSAIFGRDTRTPELFKADMFKTDGTAKYADIKESAIPNLFNILDKGGKETTAGTMLKPAKFIEHPVVKYINDKLGLEIEKVDMLAEQIAYDPAFTMDSNLFPGRNKGEPLGDYVLRLNSSMEAVRLAGMRKLRTNDGALTEFDIYTNKDPVKAATFATKAFRIEIDKAKEAQKNGETYTTRSDPTLGLRSEATKPLSEKDIKRIEELRSVRNENNKTEIDAEINTIIGKDPFIPTKEAYFKYEVTNKELSEVYKMTPEEIKMYRSIRGAVDKVVDRYNEAIKNNKDNNNAQIIEKLPNYLPHVFEGDFRVFLKKWNGKKGYQVDTALGAGTKFSANDLVKYFEKEYGAVFKDKINLRQRAESDYIVQLVKVEREALGSSELNAFTRLFENYDLNESAFIKVQEAIDKARQQTGFKKFSIQRQGVKGFLGSRIHAQEHFIKRIPLGKKFADKSIDLKQARDFQSSILTYIKGGTRAASRLGTNKELGKILNEPIMLPNGKRTTIQAAYPVASRVASDLKANAYGELTTNKTLEKFEQLGSNYMGQSGLAKILGTGNQITLNFKLLFGNMRFILSQGLQPYHMIYPKLVDLQYSGFDKGKVALSQIKAFKDLFFPNKEIKEVIEYMYKNNVVDQKFLNEASAGLKPLLGGRQLTKQFAGRKSFDYNRLMKVLTLQDISGKVEQVSRLNASLMFYNFFKSAGRSKQQSMELAAYNANRYMVEYNYLEQPGIYGSRGLGTLGKPFGLFKTFQHNYLAQLGEYAAKSAKGKGDAGLVAFMGQMVFSAGIFGVIGFQTAEAILEKLSPVMQKFTGQPIPSMTEFILTSEMPNMVKYGVPSASLGVDLTATLAAPGVSVEDLVSVPTLDFLGLNPIRPFATGKGRGVIPSATNWLITALASNDPYETREAYVKFLQSSVPTSLQPAVEQYYMGIPNPSNYFKFWDLTKEDKDIFKYPGYGPQRDPFKKGRGEVVRTFQDWKARTLSAYSLEEKEALKISYVTTRLKSNLQGDISTYLTAGAHHLMKDGYVPLYLVDKLMEFGLTYPQILERITNRGQLMNTTILQRIHKRTKSLQGNERIQKLREEVLSHGFNN